MRQLRRAGPLLAIVLTALLWAGAALAQPQGTLRIFQLNNRPAGATVDLVQQALSPTGTVLPDERLNKLIVRDTPEALERVARLLQEIDQPAPQVRIFVTSNVDESQSGGGASVGPHGVRVAAGEAQHGLRARQSLLVMSGEAGHILVGRDILAVQPYWQWVAGLGLLPPGVTFQRVSTGFAVQPTVVGDVVRLNITPWLSYVSAAGRGQIAVHEATTSVTLRPGESVPIAASSGRSSHAFAFILGYGDESRASETQIQVSAEIVPDSK